MSSFLLISPDQHFAEVLKEAYVERRLKTDPHSPAELRCNMSPSNMEAWYKAFNIKPTDKAFRPENERIHVW